MSQKTQPDSMPDAEVVDLPEISVEHSTEFLTRSAPCAGVSRPLPAAWLGQRGIYRSRLEAVCNGEQLVDPLTLGELIQRAWPSPSTELAERGTQHRFSTTEQTCRHDFYGVWWNDSGVTKTGRECRHCGFFVADMTEAAAEQAEAERPEVVAYADPVAFATFKERGHEGGVAGREWMWAEPGAALVAMSRTDECERIVGALRAENAKLSEALDRWPLIRDSLKLRLSDALARVAELERQEPVALANRGLHAFWVKWTEAAAGLYGPGIKLYAAPVAQAQQLNDLDKQCRDDVARALGLRPNQERGFAWSYLLASIKSCVKASGDSAQAQHSAGYAEARQCVNCRHIGINDAADYAACHDCRWTGPEPDEDKCPGCAGENCMAAACPECGGRYELVAEAKISTPAAQAGQMPQAWLDVQAERRRQITAEGWTPEHDDEHSHGQIARAAACYALAGSSAPNDETAALLVSLAWPWDEQWWKPSTARRDLIKAGALILAEIERLDRTAATQGGPRDA
ncbi:hypothetical protein [Pseudomonas aeruginosa]|uniref:hypothetical protein n=1 Tax=Pseudomonas aeruginosa TaxID=287 RepID=UPI00215637DB|nr:hypothetical protein [Pseudomonas aeruginosa]